MKQTKLQTIFKGNKRLVGFPGEQSSGKTNNAISMLLELREHNKEIPIYVYGVPPKATKWLEKYEIYELTGLKQISKKRDCVMFLDQFEKLKLNDRRFKDDLDDFINFLHHHNVYVILSSPKIREFNSIIGGYIDRWILKTVSTDQCINGSHLKKVIYDYKGNKKISQGIELEKNEILLINDDRETILTCDYVEEVDNKAENPDIFKTEIVKELSKKLSDKLSENTVNKQINKT